MALRKAQAARQAGSSIFKLDASQLLWLVVSVVGLFPLIVLALLALIVLLVIFAMAGGSQLTSASSDPADTGGQTSRLNALIELSGGDGRGTFDPTKVPDEDLVAPIRAAAKECDLLTPVILAAQIDYASGFDADKEGPQGRKGLSQLPPRCSTSSARTTTTAVRPPCSTLRTRSTRTPGTSATWPNGPSSCVRTRRWSATTSA